MNRPAKWIRASLLCGASTIVADHTAVVRDLYIHDTALANVDEHYQRCRARAYHKDSLAL